MIIESIERLKKSEGCEKVFCSTCGGISAKLKRVDYTEIRNQIREDLNDCSLQDLVKLGNEWVSLISRHYPRESRRIVEREEKILNINDIRSIDFYLFYAPKLSPTLYYNEIFEYARDVVVKSKDESLFETVLIILGAKILECESLLDLALEESEKSKKIKAVLYNNVRNEISNVRNFVGDGSSVSPYC